VIFRATGISSCSTVAGTQYAIIARQANHTAKQPNYVSEERHILQQRDVSSMTHLSFDEFVRRAVLLSTVPNIDTQ